MINMVPRRSRARPSGDKQYGINMENILNTKSDLKTAKLRQEGTQNVLSQTEADIDTGADFMLKAGNKVNEVDLNNDGTIDDDEKSEARKKLGRKWKETAKEDDRLDQKKSRAHTRQMQSNTNARANASAKRALEKHNRWMSEKAKADKQATAMQKFNYDRARANGATHAEATAGAMATYKEVNDSVRKTGLLADSAQEGVIRANHTIADSLQKLSIVKDQKELKIAVDNDLSKATKNMEEAKASGNQDWINIAEEMVIIANSLTDDNGVPIQGKAGQLLIQQKAKIDQLESNYGEKKSGELTVNQVERGNRAKERAKAKVSSDVIKAIDKDPELEQRGPLDLVVGETNAFTPEEVVRITMLAQDYGISGKAKTTSRAIAKAKKDVIKERNAVNTMAEKKDDSQSLTKGDLVTAGKPPRGQVSNDGKKIYDGKKWVKYNKK